jgi:hypothetical protein
MPAVEDVLRSQQNAGPYPTVPMLTPSRSWRARCGGADNENQFTTEQVLSRMVITAPATRASWVQIYEPRQTPDQAEVILEEFAIDGGETEFRDPRSATAAFRFLPLTDQQRVALEDARNERLARDGDEDAALALTTGQPGFDDARDCRRDVCRLKSSGRDRRRRERAPWHAHKAQGIGWRHCPLRHCQ